MSRFAAIRLIRGLIPTFVMLFFAACLGAVVWVSTVGLPSPIRKMVERKLSIHGNVVSMDALKVSIWGGCVLVADDIMVANKDIGPNASVKVEKLRVDLDWSSLMEGNVVVERIELDSISMGGKLASPDGLAFRTLSMQKFDMVATIDQNDAVHIGKASGFLQGMKIEVNGAFPLSLFDSSDESPKIDWDKIRSSLYDAVGYLDELSWGKDSPPVLAVNLSDLGASSHSFRVELDLRAQEFSFRSLAVRDFMLSASYAGNMVQIKKFSCRGDETSGMIDAEAALDLVSRKIHVDIRSSVPILHWLRGLTGEKLLLPYQIELTSNPSASLSAKFEMNESWTNVEKINVIGKASVGSFKINKEVFRKFAADFHYDNGDFYVSDLTLIHRDDAFTGQIMVKGKELWLDARSSLSADVLVHLVRSFGDNAFRVPQEFELRGAPDLIAKGKMNFLKGWSERPEIDQADIGVKLDDFSVRGVEIGALDLRARVVGKILTLEHCVLNREQEELSLSGELDGRDISFAVKSNFPIQIFDRLLPGMIDGPKKLTLPSSLELDAEGKLFLKEDGGVDFQRVSGTLNAKGLGWNGVVFKEVIADGSYDQKKIEVRSLKLEGEKGFLEVSAKGDLNESLHLEGKNTIGLLEWDHLLGLEDDDFFVKRFKIFEKTTMDLSFQGDLSMKDPANKHDIKATLQVKDVEYLGVKIQSGSTSARIIPGKVLLSNIVLNYDNVAFLSSRKIKGGVLSSTLKAKDINFDFKYQTVAVHGFAGTVYPDYVMKMFSAAAVDVLDDFLFTRPVTVSGSGVFPLENDFSRMTAALSFVASSGQVEYPLLGTTLKMTDASGHISISPEWVMVDRLKGKIWGGSFEGKIGARIDKGNDINGLIITQNLDLSKIGASYDKKMKPSGVNVSISFKAANASLSSIVAQGSAQLYDGDLVEIPVFGKLGKAISDFIPGVGHLINYNITSASCDYVIEGGLLKSNSFAAKGTNMSLTGGGWIRLADQHVNSDFKLGLRGLPGLFTSPVFLLAGGFFKVSGVGPLDNMNWNLAPFSSLKTSPDAKRKAGEKSSKWKFWK